MMSEGAACYTFMPSSQRAAASPTRRIMLVFSVAFAGDLDFLSLRSAEPQIKTDCSLRNANAQLDNKSLEKRFAAACPQVQLAGVKFNTCALQSCAIVLAAWTNVSTSRLPRSRSPRRICAAWPRSASERSRRAHGRVDWRSNKGGVSPERWKRSRSSWSRR